MDPELIERLRNDLLQSGYSSASVRAFLGATADDARLRGVLIPAQRACESSESSPLAAQIRILLLGEIVDAHTVTNGFPHLGLTGALELGLLQPCDDGLRVALSLNPVEVAGLGNAGQLDGSQGSGEAAACWWVFSDLDDQLRGGAAQANYVMGVGRATRSLLTQAPSNFGAASDATSALDLGTGCGIVAMYLAHSGVSRVVATDISARALMLARANAQLAGLHHRIEFRQGDLFEPVGGSSASGGSAGSDPEQFDLILSNPPFVITPRNNSSLPHYGYRSAGLTGDDLARTVVERAPAHLTPRGTLLCLANWEYRWGHSGLDRVTKWIEDSAATTAVAAWVIERDHVDPITYSETWARDGGSRPGTHEFDSQMRDWLHDFSERRVVSIGLGSIRLRRLDRDEVGVRALRAERASGQFAPSPGPLLDSAFDVGVEVENMSSETVLTTRWMRAHSVTEVREHRPGEDAPRTISFTIDQPIARSVHADPLLAAAVGACDGELELRSIAGALASIFELDEIAISEALVEGVRELAWLGMLAPADR